MTIKVIVSVTFCCSFFCLFYICFAVLLWLGTVERSVYNRMFFVLMLYLSRMLSYVVLLARKPVQHEGIALCLAGNWHKARSRTMWSHRASLCLVPALGECRKKVRQHLRMARQQNSPSAVMLVIAVKDVRMHGTLLRKRDEAVYQVLASLPVHQPRSPPPLTGDISLNTSLLRFVTSATVVMFCLSSSFSRITEMR